MSERKCKYYLFHYSRRCLVRKLVHIWATLELIGRALAAFVCLWEQILHGDGYKQLVQTTPIRHRLVFRAVHKQWPKFKGQPGCCLISASYRSMNTTSAEWKTHLRSTCLELQMTPVFQKCVFLLRLSTNRLKQTRESCIKLQMSRNAKHMLTIENLLGNDDCNYGIFPLGSLLRY